MRFPLRTALMRPGVGLALTSLVSTMIAAQPPGDYPPASFGEPAGPQSEYDQGGLPSGDDQGGPPPGYTEQQQPPSGSAPAPQNMYANGRPPAPGYPPPPPPPPGYDGTQPPLPPPGYQPTPDAGQQAAQDRQYAAYAQQWAQANCVKAHANTGEGALLGGAVGALLGSGLAGRGSRGAGALLGAGVGAAGGAVIANNSSSGATSPGCPPGFVQREGSPAFAYSDYGSPYLYAAPGWYQPWVFYGGLWTYRPYPYHAWYYRHYGWGPGYRGRGYYGPHGPYRRRW